ncbi:MAG: hydroxyacid dehydrogenase [Candidatus Eisenbacteria bacterium]|nr:hydroxyacid dehydrogenase [Candidatus Latescibacterota bacterium]MBD3303361.1 hydroxyacid dehydrogenase [Candidatus Eisenbacteria bacterium]
MDVVYLEKADPESLRILREGLPSPVRIAVIAREDAERRPERARGVEVLIAGLVPRRFLEAADRLHTLVIPYAGVPRRTRSLLADFPALRVLNSHFNADDAAEHAWALLLAAAKRVVASDALLRRADWSARYGEPSRSLNGGTLLVVGYGAIGRRVARYARAFGMRVLAVNRSGGSDPGVDRLEPVERLDDLLPEADAVVVALPDTPRTERIFSGDSLARMKRGALLVNVGRGSAVDETALYAALEEGRLGAAGIDTWWRYPTSRDEARTTPPSGRPFHRLPNVVMTPHRASHVEERERKRMRSLNEILRAIAAGKPPRPVDRKEWY